MRWLIRFLKAVFDQPGYPLAGSRTSTAGNNFALNTKQKKRSAK